MATSTLSRHRIIVPREGREVRDLPAANMKRGCFRGTVRWYRCTQPGRTVTLHPQQATRQNSRLNLMRPTMCLGLFACGLRGFLALLLLRLLGGYGRLAVTRLLGKLLVLLLGRVLGYILAATLLGSALGCVGGL